MAESQGRHRIRPTPCSNHRSSSLRRRATREEQDAEANLAEDDRIDGDRALVAVQPLDNPRVRIGLGRLGEDVGIDEVHHSVSVDSESIATK